MWPKRQQTLANLKPQKAYDHLVREGNCRLYQPAFAEAVFGKIFSSLLYAVAS